MHDKKRPTPHKLEIKGKFLSLVKSTYEKCRVNIIINSETLNTFLLLIIILEILQVHPFSSPLFNIVLGFLASGIK